MNKITRYKNYYELIINNPKYGKFIVFFDHSDLEKIIGHNWHIQMQGRSKYPITNINKKNKRTCIRMHMLIYPNKLIDHINGNGLDNRKLNLRIATKQENNRNTKKRLDGVTSKYKGVCKKENGYVAQITINGIKNYIGYYKTEKEAAIAYNEKATKAFGKFSKLNELDK